MRIPRYIVIKLEMAGKDTVKATEITDRCEIYEYEADEDEPQTDEEWYTFRDEQEYSDRWERSE